MLIRSTLVYAPAIVAPRLAAFLLVLYLTRRLGAPEFGLYALVGLIGEMLDTTASSWARFSLLRSDTTRPGAWREALRTCGGLLTGTTLLACAAAVGTSFVLTPERAWPFAISACAYIVSNSALRLGLTALQLRGRKLEFSLIETARAAGLLASAWLVTRGSDITFETVALANAAVTAAFAVVALVRGSMNLPPATERAESVRRRLVYGVPFVALILVQYSVSSSDRVVLKILEDAGSVGLYAAAFLLGRTPIDMIGNAVNQGGFPDFMRHYDERGPQGAVGFVEGAFELMSLLLIGAGALTVGASGVVAPALLPMKYAEGVAQVLPLAALGGVFMGLKSYVFDNVFHAVRRNWLQVSTYFPAGLATVVGCFLLIPPFGRTGAAAAFAIGSGAGLAASYLVTRRFVPARIDLRELAKALAAAALAAGAARALEMAPTGLPPLVELAAAGVLGSLVWAAAVLVLRPRALASSRAKVFARLGLGGAPA